MRRRVLPLWRHIPVTSPRPYADVTRIRYKRTRIDYTKTRFKIAFILNIYEHYIFKLKNKKFLSLFQIAMYLESATPKLHKKDVLKNLGDLFHQYSVAKSHTEAIEAYMCLPKQNESSIYRL